jgi:hypothetical protein
MLCCIDPCRSPQQRWQSGWPSQLQLTTASQLALQPTLPQVLLQLQLLLPSSPPCSIYSLVVLLLYAADQPRPLRPLLQQQRLIMSSGCLD